MPPHRSTIFLPLYQTQRASNLVPPGEVVVKCLAHLLKTRVDVPMNRDTSRNGNEHGDTPFTTPR